MIEYATKIDSEFSLRPGAFQAEIYEHWCQIKHDRHYPDKREFRPQKFPRFLPQMAIVSVAGSEDFGDRLTGATILEVLKLKKSSDRLVDPADANVRSVVRTMLREAAKATAPMYFKGQFNPLDATPIDFTALVLPFSHNGEQDILDTLMLAFDFTKHRSINIDFDNFASQGQEPAPQAYTEATHPVTNGVPTTS